MKIKKSWTNKLIIILIMVLLLNFTFSPQVYAWDFAGILMKPFTSLVLSFLVSVDVQMGLFLNGFGVISKTVGGIIELITNDPDTAKSTFSDVFNKLFIGPDTIFAGRVPMLNANIFNATSIETILKEGDLKSLSVDDIGNAMSPGSNMITTTREGIAKVYLIIRNICAYIMLAGLIFIGIKVLVTSNMPDKKAQWLSYVQDWLIGMILLIFSHVIMVGIFYVSDLLVNALADGLNGFGGLNFSLIIDCLTSFDSAVQIVNLIMIAYLIYLTIVFAISYFKRFLWICVLTVIAPIVSIMYAFGNSTKRIYSEWLREYITTVLIQPFHLIIYYVLVMIPINIVNGNSNALTLTIFNTFDIIYALAALSFIKPAERYIRNLFGMNKGLANMASYDNGKKTLDKAVKTTATIATTAATAGVGGAALGAVKSGQLFSSLANATKLSMGDGKIAQFLGKGVDKLEDKVVNKLPSDVDENSNNRGNSGLAPEQNIENEDSNAIDSGVAPEQNIGNEDSNAIDSGVAPKQDNDNQTQSEGNKNSSDSESDQKEDNNSEENSKNLNINQLIVDQMQADSIRINETESENDAESNETESENDAESKETEPKNKEEGLEISSGRENKKSFKEKAIDTLEEGTGRMSNFMKFATGQQGIFDTLSNLNPDSKLGKATNALMDNELGEALKKFEELGGLQQLHEGFNELRDTFDPNANGDWKDSNERMKTIQQEKLDNEKYKFIHNEGNVQVMYQIMQKKYFDKYRAQYPDKNKYPDAYINNLCMEKAKKELKSLSDIYIPLGVRNAQMAYDCEEDRKEFGLTAVDAVKQRRDFEININRNAEILMSLDNKLGGNPTTVTEKLGDARTYYQEGYRDINEMAWLDLMQKKLGKDPEYVMHLDRELKKIGGKIEYKGDKNNNTELSEAVEKINEHYEKTRRA